MEWKGCKCKHSKCLKLYCECFASGTYCDECGCVNCRNNFKNESTRQAAIAWALERKPNAFRRMAGQHIALNTELDYPRSGDQFLAPTTEGSSKLAYRSSLAGLIQPQDVKELSAFLIVVSKANNDFKDEGENQMLIIDSPANQDVEKSHGLVDQNAKTKYDLQDALFAISEFDPRSCDNDQHNERPVSSGTLELKCELV